MFRQNLKLGGRDTSKESLPHNRECIVTDRGFLGKKGSLLAYGPLSEGGENQPTSTFRDFKA